MIGLKDKNEKLEGNYNERCAMHDKVSRELLIV
jgi:hypothetical protein